MVSPGSHVRTLYMHVDGQFTWTIKVHVYLDKSPSIHSGDLHEQEKMMYIATDSLQHAQ